MTTTPAPSTTARHLGPAVRADLPALAGAVALVLLRVVVLLARPWPLALAVDHALDPAAGDAAPLPAPLEPVLGALSPFGVVVAAAVVTVGIGSVLGLLDMAVDRTAESAAERIGARLRQRVFDHAMTRSLRWHDRLGSGEVVSRLTTDVGRLLDAVVAVTTGLLPDLVTLVAVLALVAHLDGDLALVALSVVPVLAVLHAEQRRRVRAAQLAARESSGRFVSTTQDLLRNVRTVQAFDRFERAHLLFAGRSFGLLGAEQRAIAVEARWTPVAELVLAVGGGLVLVVGGSHVLAGTLSVGSLLVVTSYVRDLYSPVRGLTRLSTVLAKAGVSAGRVADVLGSTEAVTEAAQPVGLDAPRHGLRFEGVGFGYDPTHVVLDGLDLDVRTGETVALVGPSGAGKSTLLHLLLRLYDVDAGRVLVDATDVRAASLSDLRRLFGFMPQDPWLLDATLADNIAIGAAGATPEAVLAAARTALVDEFVPELSEGWATRLGADGVRLSGGQRRRVALARALVGGAPVLLLDEPTASLDPEATATVVEAIRRAAVGRTVLLVTHDERVARIAHRRVEVHRRSLVGASSLPSPTDALSRGGERR